MGKEQEEVQVCYHLDVVLEVQQYSHTDGTFTILTPRLMQAHQEQGGSHQYYKPAQGLVFSDYLDTKVTLRTVLLLASSSMKRNSVYMEARAR